MNDREGIKQPLETVIHGGRVWTEEGTWESCAVGIAGNRVAALGPVEELEEQAYPETEWVDAKEGWILSGFRESHLHLLSGEGNPESPQGGRPERTISMPAKDAKPGIWKREPSKWRMPDRMQGDSPGRN